MGVFCVMGLEIGDFRVIGRQVFGQTAASEAS